MSEQKSHRSIKSLEAAVETFIADVERMLHDDETHRNRSQHPLDDVRMPMRKLQAAFENHMGRAPAVPRNPYNRSVTVGEDPHGSSVEESHESYGLIQINRTHSTAARLFGSSMPHSHFFSMRISRARRLMREFGEDFHTDGGVPIVEITLSPAQFVEMITSQNIGQGVPCTIEYVDGVAMDPVPKGAGSEIKLTVDLFRRELEALMGQLKTADAQVAEILAKKSLTKDDKEQIRKIVHRVNRLMNDNAPFAMKLMGEHTEKLIAKGKAELDAIITMALRQAGIKAIEANGGVLSQIGRAHV